MCTLWRAKRCKNHFAHNFLRAHNILRARISFLSAQLFRTRCKQFRPYAHTCNFFGRKKSNQFQCAHNFYMHTTFQMHTNFCAHTTFHMYTTFCAHTTFHMHTTFTRTQLFCSTHTTFMRTKIFICSLLSCLSFWLYNTLILDHWAVSFLCPWTIDSRLFFP